MNLVNARYNTKSQKDEVDKLEMEYDDILEDTISIVENEDWHIN